MWLYRYRFVLRSPEKEEELQACMCKSVVCARKTHHHPCMCMKGCLSRRRKKEKFQLHYIKRNRCPMEGGGKKKKERKNHACLSCKGQGRASLCLPALPPFSFPSARSHLCFSFSFSKCVNDQDVRNGIRVEREREEKRRGGKREFFLKMSRHATAPAHCPPQSKSVVGLVGSR